MASAITEQREYIAGLLSELPGDARVTLGPSEYGKAGERTFLATIIVGAPGEDAELTVDDLYERVPEALMLMSNAMVTRCSGHRLYADKPGAPPRMGAEWTIKVLT